MSNLLEQRQRLNMTIDFYILSFIYCLYCMQRLMCKCWRLQKHHLNVKRSSHTVGFTCKGNVCYFPGGTFHSENNQSSSWEYRCASPNRQNTSLKTWRGTLCRQWKCVCTSSWVFCFLSAHDVGLNLWSRLHPGEIPVAVGIVEPMHSSLLPLCRTNQRAHCEALIRCVCLLCQDYGRPAIKGKVEGQFI